MFIHKVICKLGAFAKKRKEKRILLELGASFSGGDICL